MQSFIAAGKFQALIQYDPSGINPLDSQPFTLTGQDSSNTSFFAVGANESGWLGSPDLGIKFIVMAGNPYQPLSRPVAAGDWLLVTGPSGYAKVQFQTVGSNIETPLIFIPTAAGDYEIVYSEDEPDDPEPEDLWATDFKVMLFDSDGSVSFESEFSKETSETWTEDVAVTNCLSIPPVKKVVLRSTNGKAMRPGAYKCWWREIGSAPSGLPMGELKLFDMQVVPSSNSSIYCPPFLKGIFPIQPGIVRVEFIQNAEVEDDGEPPEEPDDTEPEDEEQEPPPNNEDEIPAANTTDCPCSPWYVAIAEQVKNVAEQLKWSNDKAREVQDKALSFFYKELVKIREEMEKLNEKVDEGKFEPLTVVENNAISLDDEMEISTGEDEV